MSHTKNPDFFAEFFPIRAFVALCFEVSNSALSTGLVIRIMLTTLKLPTSDLEIGMFVSALDRSWLDTPFLIQGFRIETRAQIESLREHCEYVFIDTRQSRQRLSPIRKTVTRKRQPLAQIFGDRQLQSYRDEAAFEHEQPRARAALDGLCRDMAELFDSAGQHGRIDPIRLRKSVEPLVESVSRNPDACLWMARLKQHDNASYNQALISAIWSVALGRELGMSRQDLRSMAMGGMLMDIGKLCLDPELLSNPESLNQAATEALQEHVQHGLHIIEKSGIINPDVINMVAHHHERWDGSGYPGRLKAEQIPAVGQMAAIVDTYSTLTSPCTYAPVQSPSSAIRSLYEARNTDFQAELVEAFIRAVGVYPAGTLVELSSGAVAVVVSEYRSRRLCPRVLALLNARKEPLPSPQPLDLHTNGTSQREPPPTILRSLEPGAYGIDLEQLAHYSDFATA